MFARKTATVVLRETKGFNFNKITVRFDSPAGLSGEHRRKLLPIFAPSRSPFTEIVGVRAFNGLWRVRAQVVPCRSGDGHLAKGSNGQTYRAHIMYLAEHVMWLDETPTGTMTLPQMRDALARLAHAERYAALTAKAALAA